MDFHQFAKWFRASSPYIHEHRNKVFAILLTQACFKDNVLRNIVRDLALLAVLDIKLLLIVETGNNAQAERLEILRKLFSRGLPSSPYRNQAIAFSHHALDSAHEPHDDNAELSNDLIDCLHQELREGTIVALTQQTDPVNLNPSIAADILAQRVSLALSIDKLILFHQSATLFDDAESVNSDYSTAAFRAVLDSHELTTEARHRFNMLLHVCSNGVKRGHIVATMTDGALLAELFTPDGSGTQVSTDDYLTIRKATSNDTDAILELIRTDIEQERLVPRNRELLLSESTTIFIAEHDGAPVGCVALYTLIDGLQEIGTLLAAPHHRDKNIGARLLIRAEKEAKTRAAKSVYVFTKHAVDWFTRHDYRAVDLDVLPDARQASYDHERQSTLLIKDLT